MFIRAPPCIASPPPLLFEVPSSPLELDDDDIGDQPDFASRLVEGNRLSKAQRNGPDPTSIAEAIANKAIPVMNVAFRIDEMHNEEKKRVVAEYRLRQLHGDKIYADDRLTSFQLSTATVPVES